MKILFVAAEVSPFAKVGGLADVVGSLPQALRALGHDVRVLMPNYAMIDSAKRWKITSSVLPFDVHMNPHWSKRATLSVIDNCDVPTYLLGTDEWFADADRSETIYRPGIDQYLFLSEGAFEIQRQLGWTADVIHCHDWQSGFIPVLMREKYDAEFASMASVFTIHNLAYQGIFERPLLDRLALPHSIFNPHGVEAWGHVNFIKAGVTYAERTNTVSPNYAEEILTSEYGEMLDGVMRHLSAEGRLSGILNGIDTSEFNPATDRDIAENYSVGERAGKATCKAALLKELGLKPIKGAPLLGVVSRISSQKGMDLIVEAAKQLFELPVQLAILGAGEPPIVAALKSLAASYPKNLSFVEGFNLELGSRIYAGCDGFLMPSAFEPCGLGQMIAMRYGTVPLVRATGGLADTVLEGVNGFVFHHRSADDFLSGAARLVAAYNDKPVWSQLVNVGMSHDFGWSASAVTYATMYGDAIVARRQNHRQTA
jgi:starch synthase